MDINQKTIKNTILKNVKAHMKRENLSKSDLVKITGANENEITILLSTGGANGSTLYRLAQAFNCAVDDFYLGIYDQRNPQRNALNVNGDRLKVINSLQDHDLLKFLADISNQDLRDSLFNTVSGLAGIFRFLDMQGIQMKKVVGE